MSGQWHLLLNFFMKRKVKGDETAKEWKRLFQLSQVQLPAVDDEADEDDLFDCTDVAVPPTFDLVENAVQDYQVQWKRLDDRKLVQTSKKTEMESSEASKKVRFQESSPGRKKRRTGGWRYVEDRLRLPYNFDYATLGPEPEDDGTGERVLSLTGLLKTDPAQQSNTLSYEKELWKLFASVPSAKQLEEEARAGAQLPHTMSLQKEILNDMKVPNPPDAHLLSRMRMADRHGLPPIVPPRNPDGSLAAPDTATIRFECWRRQLRRNPSPDPSRLVLEFLTEQTLLDLHSSLIQLAEDDLWDNAVDETTPSGCFFIEDIFYANGQVDYSKPILDWIDAGSDKPHPARRGYLGMSSLETIPVKSMKDTRLGDIPLRLGYRYYHACHGDVETAIFAVDRRWGWRSSIPYPILHDIWTPPGNIPLCDACKTHTVAYITSTSCQVTDQKRRLVCDYCRRLLQIPSESLHLYASWRDESILSANLDLSTKRFF